MNSEFDCRRRGRRKNNNKKAAEVKRVFLCSKFINKNKNDVIRPATALSLSRNVEYVSFSFRGYVCFHSEAEKHCRDIFVIFRTADICCWFMSRRHQQITLNNRLPMSYDGLAERRSQCRSRCRAPQPYRLHTHPREVTCCESRTTPAIAIKIINNREGFNIDGGWRHFRSCKQLVTKNCLLKLRLECKVEKSLLFATEWTWIAHICVRKRVSRKYLICNPAECGKQEEIYSRRWRSVEMPEAADKTCCTMAIDSIIIVR